MALARATPTPSPLRNMASPFSRHVMPDKSAKKREREKTKHLMLPPPARRRKQLILEEDEYIERLTSIINRDFFPDLKKLQLHAEMMDAVATQDVDKLKQLRSALRSTGRHTTGTRAQICTPGADTPLSQGSSQNPQDAQQRAKGDHGVGVDAFVSNHTTEDNESFEVLQEKAVQEHRKKFWWVFEDPDKAKQERLMLIRGDEAEKAAQNYRLLADGKGAEGDSTYKALRDKDDRKGVIDGWTYRARNHLMFHPELKQSCKISGVDPKTVSPSLLQLKDKPVTESRQLVTRSSMSNMIAKPPKVIRHRNTQLGGAVWAYQIQDFKTLQAKSAAASRGCAALTGTEGYEYLSTPAFNPNTDGKSPLMTWGDVEGTPLRLDSITTPIDLAPTLNGGFLMRNRDDREAVHHRLEKESRVRSRNMRHGAPTPSPLVPRPSTTTRATSSLQRRTSGSTPSSSVLRRSTRGKTPKARHAMLSPAAQLLARRFAAQSPALHGADSQLRASYGKHRKNSATTASSSRRRPSSSRRRPSSSRRRQAGAKRQKPETGEVSKQSVTDDLLKF